VILPAKQRPAGIAGFRTKLLLAMMLVVSAVTGLALFFAQRNVAANVRRDLEREFQAELAALHTVQQVRHAALAERCRALARKPRLHAALEDDALDLLYPSARDELSDVMDGGEGPAGDPSAYAFHATFYRFLDAKGRVISPTTAENAGALSTLEESRLSVSAAPTQSQIGYLARSIAGAGEIADEIVAMPITSTETGDVIATLVLGFKPFELTTPGSGIGIRSGIWLDGRLHLPALNAPATAALSAQVRQIMAAPVGAEQGLPVQIDGAPCLLFCKVLNPGSVFPAAYEVCIYPLSRSLDRQRQLLWQFTGAGLLLLLGGLAASHFLAARLSVPVARLAVDSEENRAQRVRAESALELTNEELQRSARFSADASHQLKTPVTVLRAGLEELLAGETVTAGMHEEVSALIHQTYRITGVIEDLLLLSRMDAGRLNIDFRPVDLAPLIEAWLDDFSALPDQPELTIETEIPGTLMVAGEKRYLTLILQNLLENARKYNRPGGRIRLTARSEDGWAILTVGNTGRPIPGPAQEHIFERFHRGTAAEDVPGHGLGLNLARELARRHEGDVRLARSDEQWTEFEVRFRLASPLTATERAGP
jgi:signal transduction histidine kinase